MKQTATDYLYECFINLFRQYTEDAIDGGKFGELITEAHEQAKAMEKEQIMDAYDSGEANQLRCEYITNCKDYSPEEFYNLTYKQ